METTFDAADYVHLNTRTGRYHVAEYRDGRYCCPTGNPGGGRWYGGLDYCDTYTYARRSDALRRARQVYNPEF